MSRYISVFIAAILLATVTGVGIYKTMSSSHTTQNLTTPVLVASADLPAGQTVSSMSIKVVQWPKATLPPGAYISTDSVVGRTTKVQIFAGDPITDTRLAPKGTGPGLEVHIPAGKRAMAVKINDVAGISGLIQPSSRVDVLVTMKTTPDPQSPQVAKVFMENMEVLSVGDHTDRDADGKPITATTVTLAVTPEESEKLALAAESGNIQLILRGYGETQNTQTSGATAGDVLHGTSVSATTPAVTSAAAILGPKAIPTMRGPVSHAPRTRSVASRAADLSVGPNNEISVYRNGHQVISMSPSTQPPEPFRSTNLSTPTRGTYYVNGSQATNMTTRLDAPQQP